MRLLVLLLLLPPAAGAQHYYTPDTPAALRALFRYGPDKPPLISAHRGGPAPGYPENCLATFEQTLRHVPAVVECDPQLTKDSVLVLMHDATLDRTTNGTGRVDGYTWQELRTLQLKDPDGVLTPYRIPTLAEVLAWARGRAVLMIDLKRDVPPELVERAIRRHQAEAYAAVITYTFGQAQRYHQLNPELLISVSLGSIESLDTFVGFGVPLSHVVAFTGVGQLKPALYQSLHARGVRCIVGTMGNLDQLANRRGPAVYRRLVRRGADVLATDRPLAAAAALEQPTRLEQE